MSAVVHTSFLEPQRGQAHIQCPISVKTKVVEVDSEPRFILSRGTNNNREVVINCSVLLQLVTTRVQEQMSRHSHIFVNILPQKFVTVRNDMMSTEAVIEAHQHVAANKTQFEGERHILHRCDPKTSHCCSFTFNVSLCILALHPDSSKSSKNSATQQYKCAMAISRPANGN